MDVGVVIVNYNTRELLRRCLESVYRSEGVTFSVYVVDNASQDGSAAMVAEVFPQVHLMANTDNVGYPRANNQVLRALGFPEAGQSRYALLLNPDTEIPPHALREMVAFMDAHPEAGAAGPKVLLPDGRLDLACRRSFPSPEVSFYRLIGLSHLFPRSRRFGRYNLTYLDPDVETEVDSVVGAFMLVRREAIAQVGLLDEGFFMYGEDLDWAYRLKQAGWRIYYTPRVSILHVKRAASRQNPRARIAFWQAMRRFYDKHYAAVTPRWMDLLIRASLTLIEKVVIWQVKRAT